MKDGTKHVETAKVFKVNETGKSKLAAWLLFHGKLDLSVDHFYRQAETSMQNGTRLIALSSDEMDVQGCRENGVTLALDTEWFDQFDPHECSAESTS
jgi:hypothetical protein